MVFSISYDLNKPGQDYKGLYEAIKSCGEWWHYLDSTWLVSTNLTADDIWGKLQPYVDENDRVLIVRATRPKQGWLPKKAWSWINEHLD